MLDRAESPITLAARPSRVLAGPVGTTIVFAWALVLISTAWWIGTERLTFSDSIPCVRAVGGSESSEYSETISGPATWGWLPPGKVCHYAHGTSTRPGSERVALIATLTCTAPLAFVIARRRRQFDTNG